MSNPYATWGVLNPGTPYADVWPDGIVPLRSPWPMIPREEGAPSCYLVAGELLSDAQVAVLARLLVAAWAPECPDAATATAYIRNGLPLKTTWFSVVATRRMGLLNLP